MRFLLGLSNPGPDPWQTMCVLLPGLSTPVWMTLSMVKPLGVQRWRRRLYMSRVRNLAIWLLCCVRSGYSSSAGRCLMFNLASLALLNKYNNTWGIKIARTAVEGWSHLFFCVLNAPFVLPNMLLNRSSCYKSLLCGQLKLDFPCHCILHRQVGLIYTGTVFIQSPLH